MSMSTRVLAFVEPDERHKKMKKIYDACLDAFVEPPDEVYEYFKDRDPRDEGKEVPINYSEFSDRDTVSEGIIVQVSDIPKGTVTLKFVNSY